MAMIRCWAIYDVFLGNPVLVERCATKDGAVRYAKQRGRRSCGAVHIVEQLVPCDRIRPPADVFCEREEDDTATAS